MNIGAVFVFVDEAFALAAPIHVHAYSGTFDSGDSSQFCGDLYLGGVLNCNKVGDSIAVFCPNNLSS